ncbi:MAG: NADPH:quinone reductase [Mesorhizobium sp.]|nr:NADPH:quinone reductase [Mesorhizobium sp.]
MKAAWCERNGAARSVLTVGEMATPEPGPGEVRVRVHASGANPSDVKSRRGRPLIAPRIVPHSDGAGEIDAVGKGIDHSRTGERVWLWNAQWKRAFGTAAEYCVLPSEQAVRLPPNVPFVCGACLGIPALTAIQALRLHGNITGKTLLVTGAGSSVGHYVTQIAKLRGARVIGTASEAKADHARAAGADFVIDYQKKDVAKVAKDLTQGKGVDGIVDMDLSSTALLIAAAVMAPHGTAVCYGSNVAADVPISFPAMLWNSYALKAFLVYELTPDDRRAAIADLTAMLESGSLKHAIGPRFLLRDIAAAHEAVEGGKAVGNVVVDVG